MVPSPALTQYPADYPTAQAPGVNRFLLYFHKLKPSIDQAVDRDDPYYDTYQGSRVYQTYKYGEEVRAELAKIHAAPETEAVARDVLERLFDKRFVDKIADGRYTFANDATFSFTTDDGQYTTTLTGDGDETVNNLADAVSQLYNLYIIVPGMRGEVDVDFKKYIPDHDAEYLAYLSDAEDFYEKGPGVAQSTPVTYQMAEGLRDDFFNEVDAIENGDLSRAAVLRFTHAEIVIPLASIFGLKDIFVTVPAGQTYTYDNPWRGQIVSPYTANMQWDVYRNKSGNLLVKMLYQEKERDFKADCDSAKFATDSHYYDYKKLKACYGHVAANESVK